MGELVSETSDGLPREIEGRKGCQLALLRIRVGAVPAGEIRRERQRDDEEKRDHQHQLRRTSARSRDAAPSHMSLVADVGLAPDGHQNRK